MTRLPRSRCAREGCCGAARSRHVREGGKCASGWTLQRDTGQWFVATDMIECTCPAFLAQPASKPEDRKKRRTKRNIVAHSKQAEREAAKATGMKRNPTTGQAQGFDIEDRTRGGEVKQRGIAWIADAWDQCQFAARRSGKRGLVFLVHKPGRGGNMGRSKDRQIIFVLEEISQWVDWNGKGEVQ